MKAINWKGYLLEIFTIFFSIILALMLNNWNEYRKERMTANEHLSNLKQEIALNMEEVTEKVAYHSNLAKQLEGNPDSARLILKLSRLKDYAWQIAESGPIHKYIEDSIYLKFLEIYKLQETLDNHNENVGELMSYLNVVGPYHAFAIPQLKEKAKEFEYHAKRGWIYIFEDTIYYENRLKELYTQLLEEL